MQHQYQFTTYNNYILEAKVGDHLQIILVAQPEHIPNHVS